MNEQEATELLDRLANREEVGSPAMGDLFQAGRRIRRHRHTLQLAGVAVAVTAVIAGGYALQPDRGSPTATTIPTTSPPTVTTGAGLVAPDGTRFVGEDSVVVAVPESWTTNDIVCTGVGSDTVTFNNDGPWLSCSAGVSQASVLSVVDNSSPQWKERLQLTADEVVVDGMSGLRTTTVCTATPIPSCSGILTLPQENVSFLVTSTDDQLVDDILDTAQRVPAGFVTVPDVQGMSFADARQALESRGLTLDLGPCALSADCRPYIVWPTSPGVGSAVPLGSTVTINLSKPVASPVPHGEIRGRLLISPPMTAEHPSSGSIVISGPRFLTITVGDNGRFAAAVPPGTYTVIGHSPEFGNRGSCIVQSGPVTVRSGRSVTVSVLCLEK